MKTNKLLTMQTKKIIAREFLMLVLLVLLSSIFYFSTFVYNYINENQKNQIKTEINKHKIIKDSLSRIIEQKKYAQDWFFKEVTNEYDVYNTQTSQSLWDRFVVISKNDSIKVKWNNKWKEDQITDFFKKIGFSNADSLQKFINNFSYTDLELTSVRKLDSINNEINILNKTNNTTIILSHNQQLNYLEKALLVLFVFLFAFRFFFYAIKWSIKTLKDK